MDLNINKYIIFFFVVVTIVIVILLLRVIMKQENTKHNKYEHSGMYPPRPWNSEHERKYIAMRDKYKPPQAYRIRR